MVILPDYENCEDPFNHDTCICGSAYFKLKVDKNNWLNS